MTFSGKHAKIHSFQSVSNLVVKIKDKKVGLLNCNQNIFISGEFVGEASA